MKTYGLWQKFADQGLSADTYEDLRVKQSLSSIKLLQDYGNSMRVGMKSWYYQNSLISSQSGERAGTFELQVEGAEADDAAYAAADQARGCDSGACTL